MKIESELMRSAEGFLSLRQRAEALFALVDAAPEEPVEGEDGRIALLRRIRRAAQGIDRFAPRPDWPAWQFFSGDYASDLMMALFRMTLDAHEYAAAMALAIVYEAYAEEEIRPDYPNLSIARLAKALVHYGVGEYAEAARLAMVDDESSLQEYEDCYSGLTETREMLIRRSCEAAGAWVELAGYLAECRAARDLEPGEAAEEALLTEICAAVKARAQEGPMWKPAHWTPGWEERVDNALEEAETAASELRSMRLERGCTEEEADEGLRMLEE